jgi:transposase
MSDLEQALQTIVELRQVVADREAQVQVLADHAKDVEAQLARARLQIEQMLRRQYGRSSEKLDPNQLLFDGLLIMTADQAATQRTTSPDEPSAPPAPPLVPAPRRRHEHGRAPLPEHLERVEVLIEVPEEDRICPVTGEPMIVIGYETSEKLAFEPARLYVKVITRPKLVSPLRHNGHTGVIVAPMPDFPIARCKADASLLAGIVTAKFADHLPLHRQEAIFKREGVHLSDTTMDGWLMQAGEEIQPVLWTAFRQALFEVDYVATDDTPVDLIEPGRGEVRQARLWIYLRYADPPPPGTPPPSTGPPRCQSPIRPRLIVYDFTVDRCRERPREFLGDWRGRLQADAYSGYDLTFRLPGMVEVGCWSHARRGFKEALSSRPREAAEVITRIAGLYAIEKEVRGAAPDVRLAARRERAVPILADIFRRNAELTAASLPSEPLAKACGYLTNQREALLRYTADGRLEIDNNTAENWIRPVAVGRNNWMFMGSEDGGKHNAMYLSLVQSCRCNNINPWRYLCDLFSRIMSHPANRVRELLPDVWKPLPATAR